MAVTTTTTTTVGYMNIVHQQTSTKKSLSMSTTELLTKSALSSTFSQELLSAHSDSPMSESDVSSLGTAKKSKSFVEKHKLISMLQGEQLQQGGQDLAPESPMTETDTGMGSMEGSSSHVGGLGAHGSPAPGIPELEKDVPLAPVPETGVQSSSSKLQLDITDRSIDDLSDLSPITNLEEVQSPQETVSSIQATVIEDLDGQKMMEHDEEDMKRETTEVATSPIEAAQTADAASSPVQQLTDQQAKEEEEEEGGQQPVKAETCDESLSPILFTASKATSPMSEPQEPASKKEMVDAVTR